MGKRIIYIILGLIIAMIVIVESFSNTGITGKAQVIEKKIVHKIDEVFGD